MAISYKGAVSVNATAGNGSTTVTIPADSTLAVVLQSFWDGNLGTGADQLSTITIDSQSGTIVEQIVEGSSFENSVAAAIATGFSTGASKTVAWTYDANDAISEGGYIYILFFDGASSTPVATDSASEADATAVSISLNNTATSQYAVVLGNSFSGTGPAITQPSGTTRNLVYTDDTQNSHQTDVAYYTFSTTGAKTYDITESWSGLIGVILEESAGGGGSAPLFSRHLQNLMSN